MASIVEFSTKEDQHNMLCHPSPDHDVIVGSNIASTIHCNLRSRDASATGIDMEPDQLLKAGERAWNILKAANVREGFTREDDRFPDKFFAPLKAGGDEIKLMNYNRTKDLKRDDVEKMFDDYYDERGWDINKGVPTREKLDDLDLKDVAADLEKKGLI